MPIDVAEATFETEVVERSRQLPVVVDFWAEWCGPCRTLTPALEAAASAREGKVVLAKVDVDANQRLAAAHQVQGIPAVKAFRDGAVASEFVGALPPPRVEAFFDALVPSRADELLAAGDEASLREALELEPRRADVAVALARVLLGRGEGDEALAIAERFPGDFAAEGIAARVRLVRVGLGTGAFEMHDRGERDAALDALLDELSGLGGGEGNGSVEGPAGAIDGQEVRELLRQAVVGILSEGQQGDSAAREYRRRLAAALY